MAALDIPVIAAPQQEEQGEPESLGLFWGTEPPVNRNLTPDDYRKMRASDIRWAGEGENRYPEIRFIGDGYTEQEKEIIISWAPECFGKRSDHVPNRVICDADDILKYAAGALHEQAKEQRKSQKAKNALKSSEERRKHDEWLVELAAWSEQCAARKQEIAAAIEEWQKRLGEKRVAEAQWEAYVREAKAAVRALKQTPAPPRPVKGSKDDL